MPASSDIIVIKEARSLLCAPLQVHTLFPEAPKISHRGRDYVIIPHGPTESVHLTRLGHKIPAPMLSYYDFPSPRGEAPFKTQLITCGMTTLNPRGYNLNDMGTGKTRCTLWSWDFLNREKAVNKLLVVCPLSTMRTVWGREIIRVLPGRKFVVLHGTQEQRLKALAEPADIYIINHDGVKTISDALTARKDIDVLALDEIAVYRNNSDRSKHMRKFAKRFECVWGLTGTPMPRAPTDVWGQCKIITPDTVPEYFRHAQSALMNQVSQFKWEPRPDAIHRAFSWMQPSVRYKLEDVQELPPVISRWVDVELSREQQVAYKELAAKMAVWVKEKKITAMNAGVHMGKLLQIACGYVYTNNPEFVTLDSAPRKQALVDLVESAERKVIVFAPYSHLISGLYETLQKSFDVALVNGKTKEKDRDILFGAFQHSEKYKVLLCDPVCTRHGLTLTAADTTLWYLPVTSYETYDQANHRIRRTGQKHKQQFLHLQATPVERKLYRALAKNELNQNSLLKMFEDQTEEISC